MLLEKLDRYVDYIEWVKPESEPDFNEVIEQYINSSSDERIKMLFEMDETTKQKIKSLIDGGII